MRDKAGGFSITDTKIQKGMATLLLLAHHTFVRSSNDAYVYWFSVNGKPLLNWMMWNEKICVSIFCILSGYGLCESFRKKYAGENGYWKTSARFSGRHLLKLMINFWVIFFGFALIGLVCGKITFSGQWGEGAQGVVSFLVDGLGLRDLVTDFWYTPTLNGTWWFMSTIILCYLLFPVLKWLSGKNPWTLFGLWLVITVYAPFAPHRQFQTGWIFYLAYFCLGIFFSEKSILNRVKAVSFKRIWAVPAAVLLVAVSFGLRMWNRYWMDWTHTLAVMWFVEVVIVRSRQDWLKKFLGFLGDHSANIFMMHTFFISRYWANIIFALRYPLPIYTAVVICSVVTSILIEKVKEYTGVKRLLAKI